MRHLKQNTKTTINIQDMETNEITTHEPKPPTPQELIQRERILINNLCRIAGKCNNPTFLQQLDKQITGSEARIAIIKEQNNL